MGNEEKLKNLFRRLCEALDDNNREQPVYIRREGGYFFVIAKVEDVAEQPTIPAPPPLPLKSGTFRKYISILITAMPGLLIYFFVALHGLDQREISRVVKESQELEMLKIYTDPRAFTVEKLKKYWLPAEQGGIAIKKVEAAVRNLLSKHVQYGKESSCENFHIRSIHVSGDTADVATEERWFLPLYQWDGIRLRPHNDDVITTPSYKLRKVNGHWQLQDNGTPYKIH